MGVPGWRCYSLIPIPFWRKSHGSVSSPRGPLAELPAEGSRAASRGRSWEPGAVPYLEGLASPPCGSFDEGPDSGPSSSPACDTPDDTSSASSTVSWAQEARSKGRSPSVPALRSHPNVQTMAEPLTPGNWARVTWRLGWSLRPPRPTTWEGKGSLQGQHRGPRV